MANENENPQETSTTTLVLTALRPLKDFEFDIEELSRRAREATDRFVQNAEHLAKSEKLAARFAARLDDSAVQGRAQQWFADYQAEGNDPVDRAQRDASNAG